MGDWISDDMPRPREDDGFTVVGPWGVAAFAGCALVVLWLGATGERWVPLLDSANLAFHEAGHPLCGVLYEPLGVYGGTLFQLAFPLATLAHFLRRGETLSTAFAGLWVAQNLLNVSRYMADARAMALPLVGGLDPLDHHDWRLILIRWGLLAWDTRLAGLLEGAAILAIVALVGWVGLRARRDRSA